MEKAPGGRLLGRVTILPAVLDGCWQAHKECTARNRRVWEPCCQQEADTSSQSHRKVTVSSGRPPSPAFSLSFPVWSKASRIEKAPGWELLSLIPIHSMFQRESTLEGRHQCSKVLLAQPAQNLGGAAHTLSSQSWALSVSARGARFGNQSKETKASDKLVLIISRIQDIFRTGSQEKLAFKLPEDFPMSHLFPEVCPLVVGSPDPSSIHRDILKSFLRLYSRTPQPKEIQRGICGTKKSSFYSCQDLESP